MLFAGIFSLAWFLFRVIPKPSRAYYPCMQAAYPIASAFVVWLLSLSASISLHKKAKVLYSESKYVGFFLLSVLAIVLLFLPGMLYQGESLIANVFHKNTLKIEPVHRFHPSVIDSLPARVALLQSVQDSAHHIEYSEIESMIRQAVAIVGGLDHIIRDGDVVVLKPNLVSVNPFEIDQVNGRSTDSRVIEITAKLVRELNPNGTILLMEASASASTSSAMETLGWLELDYIDEFIAFEEVSGDWYAYDAPELHVVELPDHLSLYPDEKKPNNSRALYFNKRYYEADVIISIPCLKNHLRCGITGGIKNVAMGTVPAKIYGDPSAGSYIRNKFLDHTPEYIHMWIHDFYAARPVDFVIMDGLQGLQNGPGGGGANQFLANQKNMRLIMAGKDAVAVDAIQGLIMHHDPQMVNYLVYLHNHGFGVVDPALIEVVGEKVEEVRTPFDHSNQAARYSMFETTTCQNYDLNHYFKGDSLFISVKNYTNLVRMTLSVDGQPTGKYIVGDFHNIRLAVDGIKVTKGDLDVQFEDKYLNSSNKHFTGSVGMEHVDLTAGGKLHLYPNPTSHTLNIHTPISGSGKYNYRITDISGKEWISGFLDIHNDPVAIEIGTLSNGYYILNLTAPGGVSNKGMFLKQ